MSSCTAPKSIEVNETNNGGEVELAVDQTLVVTLEGNPTTGYQWEMLPNADGVLELQGVPEYKSDSKLAGSGGQYSFILKALKTGNTNVELKYYRSFEADIPPIQTYLLNVIVK
jgi:inhibitor of cysteine peptidase